MTKGYVYILKNASMPGLLKIGKTTRSVEQRCNELFVTGVPTPFEVVDEKYAPDCGELERYVHKALAEFRVSASREFFAVDKTKAIWALDNGHTEQIELLIEEFHPGHVTIEPEMMIDPGDLSFLAHRLGLHVFELVDALHYLEPDDVLAAIERWRELRSKRGIERDYDRPEVIQ